MDGCKNPIRGGDHLLLELAVGERLMREDIPVLFGDDFKPGNWHAGHIPSSEKDVRMLGANLSRYVENVT